MWMRGIESCTETTSVEYLGQKNVQSRPVEGNKTHRVYIPSIETVRASKQVREESVKAREDGV